MIRDLLLFAAATLAAGMFLSCGNAAEIERPKITGVAHAAFYTSGYDQTRALYNDFLGFDNAITLSKTEGAFDMTVVKINDNQYVELFPEKKASDDRFYHFAVETDDAEAMRKYLASKGYDVPDVCPRGRTGNLNYFVTDPNGTICEIVEYADKGMLAETFGKNLPDTRISQRMSHVGFLCPDLDKAVSFYVDVLGFKEVWRGGSKPGVVEWVHLQVPDGEDTIELMLYDREQSESAKGVKNHICLEVADVEAAKAVLSTRKYPEGCKPSDGPKTGKNRKRQMNFYDYDGTRVEIMAASTVDGQPAPSLEGTPLKFVKQ